MTKSELRKKPVGTLKRMAQDQAWWVAVRAGHGQSFAVDAMSVDPTGRHPHSDLIR